MSQSPKSRLERVFASAPLNATAARATSGGKEADSFVPVLNYGDTQHFLLPPPMIPTEMLEANARSIAAEIIGTKFGRLTVVGYAENQTRNGGAKWVVRCACGAYAIRKTRAIRNPANSGDRCKI